MMHPASQPTLFEMPFMMRRAMPGGFTYRENFLSMEEEAALLEVFKTLPFEHATHAANDTEYRAQRRYVGYMWEPPQEGPDYLRALIRRAAEFAGIPAGTITSALVQEYTAGAPIGWHRDKPTIGHVIGISLANTCTFRLRRKSASGWERFAVPATPRSVYCMSGESRTDWQHSIPPVEALRYSITLRDFRS